MRFYNEATVVVNLTNPLLAIETFGLTPLEAMNCSLPVIVPTVGGVAELVEDGVNGYKIDVQDLDMVERRLKEMLCSHDAYCRLAKNAAARAADYDIDRFFTGILLKIGR